MKLQANLKHVTKYTEEEKYHLFNEGKIRSMSSVQKNKKAYNRKNKSWKKETF